PTLTKKSTAKITSKTGNTTLLTTVLIWPWALVQVCSTAPATSPEVAKAGILRVSSRAAVSALARIFLFLFKGIPPSQFHSKVVFFGFLLVHSHVIQDRVSDLRALLLRDGAVPFQPAVIVPNVGIDRVPAPFGLLPNDVGKSKQLLVHHTIGPVDDCQFDGVIVIRIARGGKLQLYPQ